MLVLHLLGPTRILFDDVPLTDLPAGKNLALLAYLALERWPHARERLAALLWGDMPAARAQSNLRMALYTLNNLLPEVLESGRTTVALTPDLPVRVDALALQTLAHKPEATLEELEAAVALWQGEFLHDLTLSGAVLFDEWLGPTRERIRLALFAVSERLAWAWVRSGEPMRAVPHLYRWLEIEPWHETAHRTLMFALARAGRYTEALAQYKTCVLALDRELGVPPMPETSRLAEQIQLARGLASRDNLPQVLTPLVGRASEQRQLQRLLLDPSTRLVTLVGLGGMGKTRLALHIAATLRHAFLHGVWYVALEGCTDAPGLLAAVATALNVPLTGAAPLDTTLLAALQGRELLVILDGFEGVHEHALLLNEWLRAVQGLTLLVTSRQRLALRGETVFVLEGLDPEAAGALFCACVERLKPGYDPRLDQGALEALIRLTGGMPLALELAAAWIERYSLPEIVVQVAQDSEVLSGVYRDLPAKQLSLRAIIAFAWHLLTPGAQQVLAQLAVLRGHFDEEQAAVVSGARPEVVTLLLHHALLQRPTASTFAIHELVRQFALHELAAQPTLHAQAHAAHLAHFGAMLGTQNRLLSGGETTGGALQCLAANFDNLRSAWEHACTQPEERWLEAAAEPIHKFCEGQGRYAEGEVLFRRALATVTSPALRSRLNVHYAALLLRLGRLLEALEACEAAQDALPEDLAGFAANLLGILYAARGRNQEALMAYERSLEAYRRTGDNRQIVKPLANLGPLLLRLGRVEQALKTLREGLELARAIGDRRGETHFLNNLGLAYFQQQNYANACTYYQACADLCLELNNESVRMVALYNLAEIALIQDQAPTAQTLAQEAVGLAERFGDQRNQALALRILGMAELSLGQHEAAAPILGQALSLARTTQSPPVLLDAVYGWANLLLARGATDQAAELLALLRHHPATDRHLLAQAEERAGGLPLPILSPIEAERLLSGL